MALRRGKAYPKNLRDQVVEAVGNARAVADRFGVSSSYVRKVRQLYHEDGAAAGIGRGAKDMAKPVG
jgi:transposase-like protein